MTMRAKHLLRFPRKGKRKEKKEERKTKEHAILCDAPLFENSYSWSALNNMVAMWFRQVYSTIPRTAYR
jgi:hypothetical protein